MSDLMRVSGADVTLAGLIEANLGIENTKLVKIILSGAVTKPFTIKDKAITATRAPRAPLNPRAVSSRFKRDSWPHPPPMPPPL